MPGDAVTPLDDIVRRNIATLRAKANLSQQGLADEMLHRGIGWTRETVGLVETTQRRLSFTEAIAVAASLDVPVARLAATSTTTVAVGEAEWSAAYLAATVAGTAGDVFSPESYATPRRPTRSAPAVPAPPPPSAAQAPPGDVPTAVVAPAPVEPTPGEELGDGVPSAPRDEPVVWPPPPPAVAPNGSLRSVDSDVVRSADDPQVAERIERRMRQRVTPGEVHDTAQRLWSRNLETERERRVRDRQSLMGGSEQSARSAVARDLDRELEYELRRIREEHRAPPPAEETDSGEESLRTVAGSAGPDRVTSGWNAAPAGVAPPPVSPDEVTWEATRLNILLANKGYTDSDVARWWHTIRHGELGGHTVAEAWGVGEYAAVTRLVQALPDKLAALGDT